MRNVLRRIIGTVLAISVCFMLVPAQSEAAAQAVAAVGENEYTSLDSAIEAAAAVNGTVNLLGNLEVRGVVIPAGVTLNLGAYSLTAGYVVGLNGSYLTATPNAGRLIVAKGSLVLAEQGYKNASGQYILPIWDPNQNCYLFSLFVVNTDELKGRGLFIDEANETIRFQFKHQATSAINKGLLDDGSSDNALKVIVRLVWESENGEAYQDFVYNDGFVKKVAVGENGVSFDYSFTLSGYSAMNINLDTLKVVGMIITESGAVASGTVWTAEPTAVMHTVTFVDYDGAVLKTQEVRDGESATAPPDPTRDGYTFIGWDKAFDNVTSDLVVTAQYEENISITEPTIYVGEVTARAGESVSVSVVIVNNPGVAGAKITAAFDAKLTLTSAAKGDAFAVLDYTAPASLTSGCAFNWDSLDAESHVDGTILTLVFKVPANAVSGDIFEVFCSYRNGDIYDADLNDVILTMVSGSITVE